MKKYLLNMIVYKFALFILLTGCIVFGHAQEHPGKENREVIIMINDSTVSPDDEVFVVVEQMPEFPDGQEARE